MTNGEGRTGGAVVRLAIAQIDCDLGDVEANARRIRETLAAAADADLAGFPELPLTRYAGGAARVSFPEVRLTACEGGGVGADVSLAATAPDLAGLGADAPACVVGFAEA